jgi:hypothetical protein
MLTAGARAVDKYTFESVQTPWADTKQYNRSAGDVHERKENSDGIARIIARDSNEGEPGGLKLMGDPPWLQLASISSGQSMQALILRARLGDDRCWNLSEPVEYSERRGFTYSQRHYQEIICELSNFEVFLDDT